MLKLFELDGWPATAVIIRIVVRTMLNLTRVLGLLGPNGAGKTTMVSVCTTRTAPTCGEVRIAGWDICAAATP